MLILNFDNVNYQNKEMSISSLSETVFEQGHAARSGNFGYALGINILPTCADRLW